MQWLNFKKWRTLLLRFPSFTSLPSLSSPPLPCRGSWKPARSLGERCKLPQWGSAANAFWCILRSIIAPGGNIVYKRPKKKTAALAISAGTASQRSQIVVGSHSGAFRLILSTDYNYAMRLLRSGAKAFNSTISGKRILVSSKIHRRVVTILSKTGIRGGYRYDSISTKIRPLVNSRTAVEAKSNSSCMHACMHGMLQLIMLAIDSRNNICHVRVKTKWCLNAKHRCQ